MTIYNFQDLIQNMPVAQQAFKTNRATWENAEQEYPFLDEINNILFGENDHLFLSRNDVFNTEEIKSKIIKAIYWGYPRGMRGLHFQNIINSLDEVVQTLTLLINLGRPNDENFEKTREAFGNINGVGLSTYSKWLYFLNISINNCPCMILDIRIIQVCSNGVFEELAELNHLTYNNAPDNYLIYNEAINKLATNMNTQGANVELFLFLFGNNLKHLI